MNKANHHEVTSIGQLVAELYDRYQERYHDDELANLATSTILNQLLAEDAEASEQLAA
jgi:hypothetical protein